MEYPVYLIIIVGCAAVVLWCTHNSWRKPGTKVTGLFAYRDDDEPAAPAAAKPPVPSGRWTGRR